MHTLKTMVLMVFLTVFFIFIGSLIGGKHGATIALIIALGMNFFATSSVIKLFLLCMEQRKFQRLKLLNFTVL